MLSRVSIADYRCLRSLDVPLKPLTVLIGQNNTGKSSFLSAIRLLGVVDQQPTELGRFVETDLWNLNRESKPTIRSYSTTNREFVVNRNPGQEHFWTADGDWSDIRPVNYFNNSILLPAMQSVGAAEKQGVPLLDEKASNVPAYLDVLLRKDRIRFDRILEILKKLIPGLANIHIETPTPDQRRIDLEWENGLVMEAKYASYGVMLMIFFVSLANHPTPPKIALLEEPETGVHLERLAEILKLLKGLTEGAFADKPTQVILSTHSPYLLDCIDPEKSQVLVFQRSTKGACTASPVDNERLKMFMDEFMLGEVWQNQKESGLIRKAI